MERQGYGAGDVFAVRLALEEALANAIKHGNERNPSKRVTLRFEVGNRAVWMQVEDEGIGFRVEDVPDPTAPENLDKPTGRGIFLMRQYMTSVTYNACGNCVTLWKLRAQSPARRSDGGSRRNQPGGDQALLAT
jgi:serine/threonine-protein kinase RsbW